MGAHGGPQVQSDEGSGLASLSSSTSPPIVSVPCPEFVARNSTSCGSLA
jgi:hypothetical protein